MGVFETFFQIGAGIGIGIFLCAVLPSFFLLKRLTK